MGEVLKVEKLCKQFEKKNFFGTQLSIVKAAQDISFTLNQKETIVIAGESGSGKSTIAKLILHSITKDSGKIIFEGNEVTNDLKNFKMNCQMVQQDPYDSINPRMKISDIISEPLEIHGIGDKNERRQRVIDVLKEVKLEPAEQIISKYPHMLSGGQRQRVVLARALVTKPMIIIADEPVSMLDVSIRAEMLSLMQEIQDKHSIAFIYITHDLATARYFGDRIIILYLGKIMEMGQIDTVLTKPSHPYTQALIDAISEPDPDNLYKEKKIRIKDASNIDVYSGCRFRARCPYAIDKCTQEPELEEVSEQKSVACFNRL